MATPLSALQNSSDFYRWLSELEAARSSETEEKFRRYGAALEGHLATCDGLLAVVKQVGGCCLAGLNGLDGMVVDGLGMLKPCSNS